MDNFYMGFYFDNSQVFNFEDGCASVCMGLYEKIKTDPTDKPGNVSKQKEKYYQIHDMIYSVMRYR